MESQYSIDSRNSARRKIEDNNYYHYKEYQQTQEYLDRKKEFERMMKSDIGNRNASNEEESNQTNHANNIRQTESIRIK